ncbi:MAG: alanine--tRNA ligase [Bacteroidales bacterium]|jgi:alanyl-tRNA synthetase|nr:alanine--tRNA ligase [Bacteroidales bacterium]
MNSSDVRKAFLYFFQQKGHEIEPSSSIVIKNDPTLMFTNAGMNQFKDVFLGNCPARYKRVANSQKCLRVSGKHNDLEEVGKDTYHHTMFEMLGNWSFGDYFKKEAIAWGWEFFTEVVKINRENLYVTVFGGDENDNTEKDWEAYNLWKEIIDEDRIIFGSKKDNFWEMGDTGPCGPCSEIHVDIRTEEEKKKIPCKELINKDNPQVIELWNLVFIQYQRLANGALELLPEKYVDTGLGFERLCMVLQGKKSNYDTDVFQPYIQQIAKMAQLSYGDSASKDIGMRVIADHLRAIAFAIADGQLPSNTGAGYVIRRILRRAVRYGFTFLNFEQPFMYKLIPLLVKTMGDYFPELKKQEILIEKVIQEEELSFLRTLSQGIQRFDQYIATIPNEKIIDGNFVFELFDTYGFPFDLTQLIALERGYCIDTDKFYQRLAEQKERSRTVAAMETADWVVVTPSDKETVFLGYDQLTVPVHILRYRKVTTKDKQFYQLIFDKTPFYAEAGGQVGDSGCIKSARECIKITQTKKENNLHIHVSDALPECLSGEFIAEVDVVKRASTENNHSATHLLHFALRSILGNHVEQKGSFVNAERLRFDFSHFSKMNKEEIRKTELMVNHLIRENITINDHRNIPVTEAEKMGAMALFGEKYGDKVRVVQFGSSIEFCGGTHVRATGEIGLFKIVSETAIAAGIRRIEAITATMAIDYVHAMEDDMEKIRSILNNAPNIINSLQRLASENEQLKTEIDTFRKEKVLQLERHYAEKFENKNDIYLLKLIGEENPNTLKDIAFKLRNKYTDSVLILGTVFEGKPNITLAFSDHLVNKGYNASAIIREAAKLIQGGGGGQAFLATAGGKNCNGVKAAVEKIIELTVNNNNDECN